MNARVAMACAMLIFGSLLAACSTSKQSTHTGDATPGVYYPYGVIQPTNAKNAQRDGVYGSDDAHNCCFLAGRSTLDLMVPSSARSVTFHFYVPDAEPFIHHPETVHVWLNGTGMPAQRLLPGKQDITFSIPPQKQSVKQMSAAISMDVVYVPKRLGINSDIRTLSVILNGVSYAQ